LERLRLRLAEIPFVRAVELAVGVDENGHGIAADAWERRRQSSPKVFHWARAIEFSSFLHQPTDSVQRPRPSSFYFDLIDLKAWIL
jgi:hypothetical protein